MPKAAAEKQNPMQAAGSPWFAWKILISDVRIIGQEAETNDKQ